MRNMYFKITNIIVYINFLYIKMKRDLFYE